MADVNAGVAVLADVLSVFNVPGSSTLQKAVEQSIERRQRQARDLLIEAIADGQREGIVFGAEDADDVVQMLLRFKAAVERGSAKENLRLLAQVIVGLKRNRTMEFDKFQRWAGVLEGLTRDEIIVLAEAYIISERNEKHAFGDLLQDALRGRMDPARIYRTCAALTRTGLILPVSATSGMAYMPSNDIAELGELAKLELASQASAPPP